MELTQEYFDSKISELKELIAAKSVVKSLTMSIKDVRDEYGCSEYTQRLARTKGDLPYRMEGHKDLKYMRADIEAWLDKKTIKGN